MDSRNARQAMITTGQTLKLAYDQALSTRLLAASGKDFNIDVESPTSLVVICAYGDFRAASQAVRSDDPAAKQLEITREGCVPANRVNAFFSNPFGNLEMVLLR